MEDLRRSPTGSKVAGCRRRVFTEARDGRELERDCGRRRTFGAAPKEAWKCQQTYLFIKMIRKQRTRPALSHEQCAGACGLIEIVLAHEDGRFNWKLAI
jgi:hypothetical protein